MVWQQTRDKPLRYPMLIQFIDAYVRNQTRSSFQPVCYFRFMCTFVHNKMSFDVELQDTLQ